MSAEKYIVNIAQDIVPINAESLAVKTISGTPFFIRGANMTEAVQSILSCFKDAFTIDDVVSALSERYSVATLRKLLDFLVSKDILITKQDYDAMLGHDKEFLRKTFAYSLGETSLQDIKDKLALIHIGIIGSSTLVSCMTEYFSSGGLLTNFNIGVLEGAEKLAVCNTKDVAVTIYHLDTNFSDINLIIDASDIVIIASDHQDHYLLEKVNKLCVQKNKKWLRVVIDCLSSEVGPLFIPGETCCYYCMRMRNWKYMSADDYTFDNIYAKQKTYEAGSIEEAIKFSSLYQLNPVSAGIACNELTKYLVGMRSNITSQVIMINGMDFQTQTAYVYKNYMCPVCAKEAVIQ